MASWLLGVRADLSFTIGALDATDIVNVFLQSPASGSVPGTITEQDAVIDNRTTGACHITIEPDEVGEWKVEPVRLNSSREPIAGASGYKTFTVVDVLQYEAE